MPICKKEHRYAESFKNLPDSQSPEQGRHLCAGCAYEEGYTDGLNNQDQRTLESLNLPKSQAGSVRHKSAQAAYSLGWQEGRQKFQNAHK
ncbi:hypothetical protein [Neisseria weixii]|uniref:hypothetical protein n=1 Tax=Neisseria weixii TaxID=1853276 RepID=UPI00359FF648